MATSPERYKRLIKELPKHKHAKDALIASGFSESTANKQSKRVLRSALKEQAREILKDNTTEKTGAKLMSEILDISSSELYSRLKWIAIEQDKDLSSALKILQSLSKEHNILIGSDDTPKVVAPILNITVEKRETPVLLDSDSQNVEQ